MLVILNKLLRVKLVTVQPYMHVQADQNSISLYSHLSVVSQCFSIFVFLFLFRVLLFVDEADAFLRKRSKVS